MTHAARIPLFLRNLYLCYHVRPLLSNAKVA